MKAFPPLLFFISAFLLLSCKESVTEPDIVDDPVSGIYHLTGMQIKTIHGHPPTEGYVPVPDTSQISFTMEILRVDSKPDTIRVTGLEGVDRGQDKIYPDSCSEPGDCFAYAKFSGKELEIDLNYWGYSYRGEGSLENGIISLTGRYGYRGTVIDYLLEGYKEE